MFEAFKKYIIISFLLVESFALNNLTGVCVCVCATSHTFQEKLEN